LDLISNLLLILSHWFHEGSHPLLPLARIRLSLLVSELESDPSILDEAIRAAALVAAGNSSVYPADHPSRGLAYAELGKLMAMEEYVPEGEEPIEATPSQLDPKAELDWVVGGDGPVLQGFERLRIALFSLVHAHNELRCGFGYVNEGGAAGKEATELSERVERELDEWRRAGGGRRPGTKLKR
jgi:hypothetical protein